MHYLNVRSRFRDWKALRASRGISGEKRAMMEHAFAYTAFESVKGVYLEFGVARGLSMVWAYRASLKNSGSVLGETSFYGFDSFLGFPEPKGVDANFARFNTGQENHGGIGTAIRFLKAARVDLAVVKLIEGYYDDTLTAETLDDLAGRKARVVHFDCDMFASTSTALEFVTPLLQDGAVLLFDDWFCYRGRSDSGQQLAKSLWSRNHPEWILVPWRPYGNVGFSFIAHFEG